MKKVLILTYYWPPSGGAGVQRWLKFVKYLPQFGVQPVVYTHSNGEVPSIDESLVNEVPDSVKVLKTSIWEPYGFYKSLTGKKDEKINTGFLSEKETKQSRLQNLSIWIRGNFFIPDARKFWIKPSIKFLDDYINENDVDTIISTGPPHSMHLIALGLKKKHQLKWIADFRDPWTNIDFYKDLMLTRWADKKHHKLEKEVLTKADVCISVGPTLSQELIDLGANKCITITNGYDPADYQGLNVDLDSKISIAHIGSFTKTRNPELLLDVLRELRDEKYISNENLELKLVGKVDYSITQVLENQGMASFVRKVDYMPHDEVLQEQRKSHFLLLVVNDTPNAKGILTGKIFEYLAAKRPIIAIAPEDGDLANLIRKTNSGVVLTNSAKSEVKSILKNYFETGKHPFTFSNIEDYSRENLTRKLADIILEP